MNKVTVIANAMAFTTDGRIIEIKGNPVKATVGILGREKSKQFSNPEIPGENDPIF